MNRPHWTVSGRILAHLGNAYTLSNRLVEAEVALLRVSELFDDVHMYRGYTLIAFYKANFYRQQGRFEDAQQHYQRAITLFDDVQDRYGLAQCLLEYARCLRIQGNKEDEAQGMAHSALTIYKERGTEEQVEQIQRWIKAQDDG